ncbi:hypothetical protein F5I97DRAFT_847925 [Phlebopus sp. FC_14]|nr:hypothetical protein F5I97DRAFT_847925 [Phlebopus sp. FC_14]
MLATNHLARYTSVDHCFFQGIILVQAVQYWEFYRTDPRSRRAFVALVVLLSIAQTGLETHKVWKANINRQTLVSITGAWFNLFLNGFICGLNKLFLLRRCWQITNKSRWVIVLLVLTITTIAANLIIVVTSAKLHFGTLSPHQNEIEVVAFAYWTTTSFVLDVILAGILVSFLWRHRTGMGHLDWALMRFFAITTESATWPALCMAIAVGLYDAENPRSNSLTFLFLLVTGKLYTLSLLRTLNARAKLHERIQNHDLGRMSLGKWGSDETYQSFAPVSDVVPELMHAWFTCGFDRLELGSDDSRGFGKWQWSFHRCPKELRVQRRCNRSSVAFPSPCITSASSLWQFRCADGVKGTP